MEPGQFTCSICGDASRDICVYCTKDACANHICERCHRCSDCCQCDVPMEKATAERTGVAPRDSGPVAAPTTDPSDPEHDLQPL